MNKSSIIKQLLLDGKSYTEIAAATGASKGTISYHSTRLGIVRETCHPNVNIAREMIKVGSSNEEVRAATALSLTTICKIRRKEKIPASRTDHKTYDWAVIQAFHDAGNRFTACRDKFGFASETWHKAKKRGDIVVRDHITPLKEVLIENGTYHRGHLKSRLIAEGILPNVCSNCSLLPTWDGKPLVLILDHINGVNDDNRLENLRLLCPNCNSQTETFAGRNTKRVKEKRLTAQGACPEYVDHLLALIDGPDETVFEDPDELMAYLDSGNQTG